MAYNRQKHHHLHQIALQNARGGYGEGFTGYPSMSGTHFSFSQRDPGKHWLKRQCADVFNFSQAPPVTANELLPMQA